MVCPEPQYLTCLPRGCTGLKSETTPLGFGCFSIWRRDLRIAWHRDHRHEEASVLLWRIARPPSARGEREEFEEWKWKELFLFFQQEMLEIRTGWGLEVEKGRRGQRREELGAFWRGSNASTAARASGVPDYQGSWLGVHYVAQRRVRDSLRSILRYRLSSFQGLGMEVAVSLCFESPFGFLMNFFVVFLLSFGLLMLHSISLNLSHRADILFLFLSWWWCARDHLKWSKNCLSAVADRAAGV